MKNGPRNLGFSLIELMMVISILSVLTALGMMSHSIYRAKGQQATAVMTIRNLATLVSGYATNAEGVFPSDQTPATWITSDHTTATSCFSPTNPFGYSVTDCRKLMYWVYYVSPSQGPARLFIRERYENNQRMVFRHCPYVPPQQQQQQQQQQQAQNTVLSEGGQYLQYFPLDTYLYSFTYMSLNRYQLSTDSCRY